MLKKLQDPHIAQKIHLAMAVLWVILVIPTLLWWRESILWVLVISLYANIASHLSAYQGAKSEEVAQVKDVVEDVKKAE